MKNAVITAKIPENIDSLRISIAVCFSDKGFFAIISLTSVIGASLSSVVCIFSSSLRNVGFLISLC